MSRNTYTPGLRRGFTLTELLVAIIIIGVLAVLIFGLARGFIRQAAATRDANTLRQMWTCIHMYSGDHNDLMPGPLFTRQNPIYNKPLSPNPREWRRLSDCLAPYLGYENPKSGEFIEAMAASWQKSESTWRLPAYYMQQKLPIGEAGTTTNNPWGIPAPASAEDRMPMRYSVVTAQPRAARTWAITELDKAHPSVGDPDSVPGMPEGMAHGTYRLGVYFDGRIGKFDRDNNPL
jgi:prepilin-type N-terminal cleavage/methylation domain-containing protein